MNYSAVDPAKATTLAYAVHDSDGSQFPWALRSGSLTYIGENPFVYTNETDRLRVFEDLLYDALNPFATTQHRALLRLEDINPNYDATALKAAGGLPLLAARPVRLRRQPDLHRPDRLLQQRQATDGPPQRTRQRHREPDQVHAVPRRHARHARRRRTSTRTSRTRTRASRTTTSSSTASP